MGKSFFDQQFTWWVRSYFTLPAWHIAMLVTLIIGFIRFKKDSTHQLFLVYTAWAIFVFIIVDIKVKLMHDRLGETIVIETCNTLFALVEIMVFMHYFTRLLDGIRIRQFLRAAAIFYLLLTVVFFLRLVFVTGSSREQIASESFLLNVIEFMLLLAPCLTYFYRLLAHEDTSGGRLKDSPAFWIVSGLFLYILISLPFLLVAETMHLHDRKYYYIAFSFHFFSIAYLFFCISKAFLCKAPLTA